MSTPPIEKVLYRKREAAEALSIPLSTLDAMIAKRLIATRRVGRLVQIPRSEVLRIARKDTPHIRGKVA